MIKTSIIIPVFNSEKYLKNTIECLINQTCKDIEIIFVNDGSTDNSLNILKEYAQKDFRIKVFSQENKGAGAARNFGLAKANGETVMFLDSDDEFSPKLVELLYKKLTSEKADIAYSNFNIIQENGSKMVCRLVSRGGSALDFTDNIFSVTSVFIWNKIFKKSFVENYGLKFTNTFHSNDIAFVFLAVVYAKKFVSIDDYLINYIKRDSSISFKRTGDNFCDVEVYKYIIKELKNANLFHTFKKALYKILIQSYYDQLFILGRKTKYDYIKTVKKMKKLLPYEALFYRNFGRKFILIKFLPAFLSYYYFMFKKFTNSKIQS